MMLGASSLGFVSTCTIPGEEDEDEDEAGDGESSEGIVSGWPWDAESAP